MKIRLYKNKSENNAINKDLTLIKETDAVLKDASSLKNPTFDLAGVSNVIMNVNYIEVPKWKRFYFISTPEIVRNGLWRISCSCDVLESFKDEILENTGLIARQEYNYNLLQQDPELKVYQNSKLEQINFGTEFSPVGEFVICVNGGKHDVSQS